MITFAMKHINDPLQGIYQPLNFDRPEAIQHMADHFLSRYQVGDRSAAMYRATINTDGTVDMMATIKRADGNVEIISRLTVKVDNPLVIERTVDDVVRQSFLYKEPNHGGSGVLQ